jgi:hypothetical protein
MLKLQEGGVSFDRLYLRHEQAAKDIRNGLIVAMQYQINIWRCDQLSNHFKDRAIW